MIFYKMQSCKKVKKMQNAALQIISFSEHTQVLGDEGQTG